MEVVSEWVGRMRRGGEGLWVMGFRENHIRNIYKYDRRSAGAAFTRALRIHPI